MERLLVKTEVVANRKHFISNIQIILSGLKIEKISPKSTAASFFHIKWILKKGTDPEYSVTVNNEAVSYKVEDGGMIGVIVINGPRIRYGIYTVEVVAKNAISGPIHAEETFQIFPEITQFNVTAPKKIAEVNETIPFGINMASDQLDGYPQYRWSFGDDSKVLENKEGFVYHKYLKNGVFIVTVTVFNPASSQSAKTEIQVLKPVLPLIDMFCKASPVPLGSKTTLTCLLGEGSDFTCIINWFNKFESTSNFQHLQYNQFSPKSRFQSVEIKSKIKFLEIGSYKISATCSNRLSQVLDDAIAIIEDPIRGLKILDVQPKEFGEEFRIRWEIDSGSKVSFKAYWDNKVVLFRIWNEVYSTFIKKAQYGNNGTYKFMVSASNLVTKNVKESISVVIEKRIKEVSVHVGDTMDIYSAVKFVVNIKSGSNPNYRYNFGDTTQVVSSNNIQHHVYGKSGKYEVTVTAFNNVSESGSMKVITIQEPISILGVFSVASANVSSILKIVSSFQEGSDFICVMKFGDGNMKRTSLLRDSSQKKHYTDLNVTFKYAYGYAGNYTISLTCRNEISEVTESEIVSVLNPVVSFRILIEQYQELSAPVIFKLTDQNENNNAGHRYHVKFGDYSKEIVTNDLQFVHTYSTIGSFDVSVTALNPVSQVTIRKNIQIVKPVLILTGLSAVTVPVNVTEATVLEIALQRGSDFQCSIQWTKEYMEIIKPRNMSYNAENNKSFFANILFVSSHVFNVSGRYHVSVKCWNRLSRAYVITQAFVQEKPSKDFALLPVSPQKFGSRFYVDCEVYSASDFVFQLKWNGIEIGRVGSCKFLITPSMYLKPGFYRFSMTASIKGSPAMVSSEEVIIEHDIEQLTLVIANNQSIFEVNETVKIRLNVANGTNVLYNIDYGDGNVLNVLSVYNLSHEFHVDGHYNILLVAYNNVSQMSKNILVVVNKACSFIKRNFCCCDSTGHSR